MCEGSIHVAHRIATDKESLVLRSIPDYRDLMGLYPSDPKAQDQRLVCVRRDTEVMIQGVQFKSTLGPYVELKGENETVKAYITNRGNFIDLQNKHDRWTQFPLSYFREGMRVNIGIPFAVPTEKGVAAVEQAVTEATKIEASEKETQNTGIIAKIVNFVGAK